MAKIAVHMPKYGMTMTEGIIVEWLKQRGDSVKEGDALAIIETEKVETELEAPATGQLVEILHEAEAEVPVGDVIAYIEEA